MADSGGRIPECKAHGVSLLLELWCVFFVFLQLSSADLFVEAQGLCIPVMTGARFNCFSDDQEVCAFIKNIPFGSVFTHYCQATLSSQLSSHVGAPRTQNCRSLCVLEHRAIQVPPT